MTQEYNGIIVVNKREGIGSTDCVRIVRRLLKQKKVGHSGTLDELATGVLVICLGKATKLIEYLQLQKKTYIATLKFGEETDTLDREGIIINTSDKKVTKDEFIEILPNFIGSIDQIPPMYSALKHNGVRLYDLARSGITVERKKRTINIFSIDLLDFNFDKQVAKIKTTVSAGTYIRTLIDDLGKCLNNYAHMLSLNRIQCSGFNISQAIDICDIKPEILIESIVSIEESTNIFDKYYVNSNEKDSLLNGMTIQINSSNSLGEYVIVFNGVIIGIGNIFKTSKGEMLKLKKHLYTNENN